MANAKQPKEWNRVNVIMVLSKERDKLLFCKRRKDPYKGLYNMVGGKLEKNETSILAAYRELKEETGITRLDIQLHRVMDLTYYVENTVLEVYVGRLIRDVQVAGAENDLEWLGLDEDFFDDARFAGKGNIGHIWKIVREHQSTLLGFH